MFAAHARLHLPPVELDFDLGIEERVRVAAMHRTGTIWDTRFIPPSRAEDDRIVVYLVLAGAVHWIEPAPLVITAPGAFVCPVGQFSGALGRHHGRLRTDGSPFRSLELHVRPSEMRRRISAPTALALSPHTLETARRYVDLVTRTETLGPRDRDPLVAELLRHLHADDVFASDLSTTLRPIEGLEAVLWSAVQPFIENVVLGEPLDKVSSRTRLSLRQLNRAVSHFLGRFDLPWTGWRAIKRSYQLKVAAILLSNPQLGTAAIAERCGYSSAEALAHAFSAEGMLPPAELGRCVREEFPTVSA